MYPRIVLFNIVEPANNKMRCGIGSINVELWSLESKSIVQNLVKISNCIFQLCLIEFASPESHRLAILDNVCPYLIAGSISMDAKRYVVIWIGKQAVLCHERIHVCEDKIHFIGPIISLLPRLTGERRKNVCALWPLTPVVIESAEEVFFAFVR